jgi:hypothetical protein
MRALGTGLIPTFYSALRTNSRENFEQVRPCGFLQHVAGFAGRKERQF